MKPQQINVISEMARALEDARVTRAELQQITNSVITFMVGTFTITLLMLLSKSIAAMMEEK